MENSSKRSFENSLTLKGLIIAGLVLLLLIPKFMVQGLVHERQARSEETIRKIDAKWSDPQTICVPVICIPCHAPYYENNVKRFRENVSILRIMPEKASVSTALYPEERRYNIFRTIVYRSESRMEGSFAEIDLKDYSDHLILWDRAYVALGVSDLRGVAENVSISLGGREYALDAAGFADEYMGQMLTAEIDGSELLKSAGGLHFSCDLSLKGSRSIDYVPLAKNTRVDVAGDWPAPSFTGGFSPEYTLSDGDFTASWNILGFNRNIPDKWMSIDAHNLRSASFGVSLISPVDHYQQNMRSVKYAPMFIVLTFGLFFFVELICKKRIHPVQYALVGLALIIFYSLLLSFSEQMGFGPSYLIASAAVVCLVTAYSYWILRSRRQAGFVAGLLVFLYGFLYAILQLEDIALLIGSIGLFLILALAMYLSRRINWYGNGVTETKND